jgi:hypothetical protein
MACLTIWTFHINFNVFLKVHHFKNIVVVNLNWSHDRLLRFFSFCLLFSVLWNIHSHSIILNAKVSFNRTFLLGQNFFKTTIVVTWAQLREMKWCEREVVYIGTHKCYYQIDLVKVGLHVDTRFTMSSKTRNSSLKSNGIIYLQPNFFKKKL